MANYFNPCNCQGFYNNPDRQTTPGQFSPGNVNGSPSVTALPPLPTGYPTGPMYSPMLQPAAVTPQTVPSAPLWNLSLKPCKILPIPRDISSSI